MNKTLSLHKSFLYLLLPLLFFSCKPTISLYDQYAYTQATSLKVDLQNIALSSDTVQYEVAKPEIDQVNTSLQKAYEYNKGRDNNSLTAKQYAILLGEENFYKSFLKDWKAKGKESPAMAENIAEQLGDLMDEVIRLEYGKNK